MDKKDKIKYINRKLESIRNKCVVIWGAGEHTKRLFESTEIALYDIKNIIDIDINKQGKKLFGLDIISPDALEWDIIDAVIVSIMRTDISKKLKQYDFSGEIINFYESNKCVPFYLLQDEDSLEQKGGYLGDFKNWEEASVDCKGYDDGAIFNKVIEATNAVLNDEAAWERDTRLFYEKKFNYKICAPILRCALEKRNERVCILDIGGALGSTYFQNRKYLEEVNLQWFIAEQKHYAEYGQKDIENNIIKFICSEDDYSVCGEIDIVLLSGSLQYIENYEKIIQKILCIKPQYIIVDRIVVSKRARICKQVIPKIIFDGSYPVKIFSEAEMETLFGIGYELVEKDTASVQEEVNFDTQKAVSKMYVYKKTAEILN